MTNGWQISDHRTLTGVYAGADPRDRSTGRLVVFRQDFIHVTQTSDRVDVPRAGPLEITSAPHASAEQTSAQQRGKLQFRGEHGVKGTLNLVNDTATVSR